MAYEPYPSYRRARPAKRRSLLPTALLVALSLSPAALFVDFEHRKDAPSEASAASVAAGPAPAPEAPKLAVAPDRALIDPKPALNPGALAWNAPLQPGFRSSVAPEAPVAAQEPAPGPAPSLAMAEAAPPVPVIVPLPVPRPADLQAPKPPAPTQAASAAATPRAPAAPAAAPEDNRSFFEKLFGIRPAAPPEATLSYAALDRGTGSIAPTARFGPMPEAAGAGTAVYDIVAQTLTLPNGERLEAHSGLGPMMDDPRYVNVRMKGATPPGTYIVTEREALFHGVRALRLTPVGGSAAIYGRDGILAHPYLLGPRGDSNGCVSLKNYDRLLQAYLRGEVKRLVVTAGRGQDLVPRLASRRAVKNS
ncbi:DUF2778 domain-containing protein [Microvirga arsenatis]|uniref:DUF2778 domain-containing protein n=1 Tax=Microvirga arsenatis TaxID=2692265 RepID=A0ABW9Z1K3_9HYPH|nr:DUF2778 domain-containing protein [Microvirga arsenatis]NBJ13380.1 DUF2778 domain-containing protein [Microvirga arsenatis]NBJ26415.1 DUF2778 domain-containing protein [Microvirga arsenatis]